MKQLLYWKLAEFLTKVLAQLSDKPKLFEQTLDTSMGTLNTLWQTPAVHGYLDGREARLKEMVVDALLSGQRVEADKTAGALYEIRMFRDKLQAAHTYVTKKREALTKASNT